MMLPLMNEKLSFFDVDFALILTYLMDGQHARVRGRKLCLVFIIVRAREVITLANFYEVMN